jgi:hypothetical protein
MPALNGKDRAAARLLVAAVVTLLALFVPPSGIARAAARDGGPLAGSTDSMWPSGARPVVLRQTRGHAAPALAFGSIPPAVLPSAPLVTAALIGLGAVAGVADSGPRWPRGWRLGSRAPPASAS